MVRMTKAKNLPSHVIETLERGYPLAAEVSASLPGHRAWVYMCPDIDWWKTQHKKVDGIHRLVPRGKRKRLAIKGYLLRYMELNEDLIKAFHDDTLWEVDQPTVDVRILVKKRPSVLPVLRLWLNDLDSLMSSPASNSGYYWDGPATLFYSLDRWASEVNLWSLESNPAFADRVVLIRHDAGVG